MRNQLIKELKETSYWNLVFKEDTIIAYFGGSELIGFRDEISDYDIICITKTPPKQNEYNEYLVWNKKKVHFVYRDINDLFNKDLKNLGILTITQLQALNNNDTVFYNTNQSTLQFLLNNSYELLKVGIYALYEQLHRLVDEVVSTKSITKKNRTKYLYHLVYAKRTLLNESIEVNYLTNLKRIRWREIDKKHTEECIKDLTELKQYIELNPYDRVKTLELLKQNYINQVNLK